MKKTKYILSLLILCVMGFLFLHSELDFFTPEQHLHNTHDFCEIINGAKTEKIIVEYSKVFYTIPEFDISSHLIYASKDAVTIEINSNKLNPHSDLNILFGTFLI